MSPAGPPFYCRWARNGDCSFVLARSMIRDALTHARIIIIVCLPWIRRTKNCPSVSAAAPAVLFAPCSCSCRPAGRPIGVVWSESDDWWMVRLPGPLCCFCPLWVAEWVLRIIAPQVLMRWIGYIWLTVSHGVISFLARAEPGLVPILCIFLDKR